MDTVKWLMLEGKAHMTAKDWKGNTALDLAKMEGRSRVA
eukprot:CAMPEP_0167765598 /NCGR_PEP_ID=MMETSP0110_2-20121227/14795_1 /TAXON_ID=629695 /ORGANISM="Gymnochlora sp., Strain CCMP2014" /LENGTH=38 /DNA_ID= /DNA_START= /DNA_END= /DNA_ORIENTATION=